MNFEEEYSKYQSTKNWLYKKHKFGKIVFLYVAVPFFLVCTACSFIYAMPIPISLILILFVFVFIGAHFYFSRYELVQISPSGLKSTSVNIKWSDITKIQQDIFLDIEIWYRSDNSEQKIIIPNVPLFSEYISRLRAKETGFYNLLNSMVESSKTIEVT